MILICDSTGFYCKFFSYLSTMVHNGVLDASTVDNHALLQFNIKRNTVKFNMSVRITN